MIETYTIRRAGITLARYLSNCSNTNLSESQSSMTVTPSTMSKSSALSKLLCHLSSSNKSVNSRISISSIWLEFHAARSGTLLRHANFMSWSSSNFFGPRRARRSSAISLAAENRRSQGTEDAGIGRTSKAIRPRVGYNPQLFYWSRDMNYN